VKADIRSLFAAHGRQLSPEPAMITVTIGIASLGRPCLSRTLASLCELELPPECSVDIVVADDDREGAARARVDAGVPWPLPVRAVPVGSGNISVARNACLDAAYGDWVAFVDDDEWVAKDWLVRLLAAQREFSADVVVGPVHPQYPAGTPDWLVAANPAYVEWGHRGLKIDTGRSGNVLIRRSAIEREQARFDPALGKTGGEDTDFFHRLHRVGAVLIATDDALAFEEVPPNRLEPGYLRRRALRSGQSYARFRLRDRRGLDPAGLWFHADAAVKCVAGLCGALALRPFRRAGSLRLARRGWMNLGKLRQLTGHDLPSMY
jgi:succinoglycan biosynthesis protein ExoM